MGKTSCWTTISVRLSIGEEQRFANAYEKWSCKKDVKPRDAAHEAVMDWIEKIEKKQE